MVFMLSSFFFLISLFLITSPMIFVLWLVLNIFSLMYIMVSFYFLSGFLSLLFMMIYLGAMMILIGYVCAITPFVKFSHYHFLEKTMFSLIFFFIILLCQFLPFKLSGVTTFYNVSTFFLSVHGGFWLFFISLMMLMVLLLASNSVTVKSPFRLL